MLNRGCLKCKISAKFELQMYLSYFSNTYFNKLTVTKYCACSIYIYSQVLIASNQKLSK